MGDRGNIVIHYEEKGAPEELVYFYTHWQGSYIKDLLGTALKRKERWNDAPYLARIIFSTLIGNDHGEHGFVISPYLCDNEPKEVAK